MHDLPPMHTKAPVWFEKIRVRKQGSNETLKLSTLGHIIGEQGELMLVHCDKDKIAEESEVKTLVKNLIDNKCWPILEPGFSD